MIIQKKGYGISVFNNKREAYLFIRNKKNEYINAKEYIKLWWKYFLLEEKDMLANM